MKEHKAVFAVGKMCKVFKVSRSGYYHWLKRKPSARQIDNQQTLRLIREIHKESKGRYGSPKITRELHKKGVPISRPRVARIMKKASIRSIVHKRYRINTTGRRSLIPGTTIQ